MNAVQEIVKKYNRARDLDGLLRVLEPEMERNARTRWEKEVRRAEKKHLARKRRFWKRFAKKGA